MQSRRGTEVLYGRQPVLEMLRANRRQVKRLVLRSSVKPRPDIQEIEALAAARDLRISATGHNDMDRLCGDVNHQGVAAVVSPYPYFTLNDVVGAVEENKSAFVLFLDHLEDPQNLGSLVRTAESAGVTAMVIPERRSAGITPAAARASAGAAEHARIALVANLVQSMKRLKECGLWIAGLERTDVSVLYTQQDLKGPVGLVVGSEGTGMSRLVRETCDFLVHLPQQGRVSSLNAGVAGGIAMYEILRQRAEPAASPR